MAEIKEKVIWEFADRLRLVVPFYGFSSNAIELIFMKYMSDYSDVSSPEEFKTLMSYKDMFIIRKFDIKCVTNIFRMVESKYNIEQNLLDIVLDDLIKIFEDKREEYLFAVLSEFEIPKASEEMSCLLEAILSYGEKKDVSRTELSSTNTSLVKLVDKILDVKEDEIYMDSFAGFSKSSLRIDAKEYLGYEINPKVAAIANMIMILSGKKNFTISNQNYYLTESHSVADKVFSDGPLCVNLSMDEYYRLGGESRKGDYYTVKKSVESLKPNGRAVVTCVGSVLFRNDFRKLREQLTFRNLKAVIALPALWRRTSVSTNLIVFDNERVGNDVIMIDASSNDYIKKIDKRNIELTDDVINKIIDSLNGKIIEGFSNVVPSEMILCGTEDQSWAPARYIKKKMGVDFRPSAEVKVELDKTYDDLYRLLRKGVK